MKKLIDIQVYKTAYGICVVKDGKAVEFTSPQLKNSFGVWLTIFNRLFYLAGQYDAAETHESCNEFPRYSKVFSRLHDLIRDKIPELHKSLDGTLEDLNILFNAARRKRDKHLQEARQQLTSIQNGIKIKQ